MLLDNLYTLGTFEKAEKGLKAQINIDPTHDIFRGHFPSVPVVPGVCMMQIVKELLEKHEDKTTRIGKVSVMKFMAPINPKENPQVTADLTITPTENSQYLVAATLSHETVTFFKFKGTLF